MAFIRKFILFLLISCVLCWTTIVYAADETSSVAERSSSGLVADSGEAYQVLQDRLVNLDAPIPEKPAVFHPICDHWE